MSPFSAHWERNLQIWLWPQHRDKHHGSQAVVWRKSNFSQCCGPAEATPTAPHTGRSTGCRITLTSILRVEPAVQLSGVLAKVSSEVSTPKKYPQVSRSKPLHEVGGRWRREAFRSTDQGCVSLWGRPGGGEPLGNSVVGH